MCLIGGYFFLAALMLSTILGYGLPAALADDLAFDFWEGVSAFGLPIDFGRFFSHIGFLILICGI